MAEEEAGQSLLDRLRADHAALSVKHTIDKPLPGYPALVARFKAIGRDTVVELRKRAEKVSEAEGNDTAAGRVFDADLLINTCAGVFERRGDELIPLNTLLERWGDEPIVFDERLAEAVGATLPDPPERTARSIVFAIFKIDEPDTGNDLRFAGLATQIWDWVRNGQDQADADF